MLGRASIAPAVLLVACGARSDLLPPDDTAEETPSSTTSSTGSGAGGDAPAPLPPCYPVSAGDAAELITFPDRHAIAPSIAIAPGDGPERVFVQAFASGGDSPLHSDIQLAELRVGSAWPAGVEVTAGPALFGFESHGWAVLSPSPPSRNEIALAWHGDPGGFGRPMLRRLDLGANSGLAPVDLARSAEAVLDLVAGADGYAVVWRQLTGSSTTLVSPTAALLDLDGNVVAGPFSLTQPRDYPGRGATLTWTGSEFLAAVAFDTCQPNETELCREQSVVVTRIGPGAAAPTITTSLPIHTPGLTSRPYLASHRGRTYVAWSEGEPDVPERRTIRVAEIDAGAGTHGPAVDVAVEVPARSRPTLIASEAGVTLAWAEAGRRSLPPGEPGHDNLVISHLDADLEPLVERSAVGIPFFNDYGPPHGVALADPRSLLFVVSALRAEPPGYDGVFAARFDCR